MKFLFSSKPILAFVGLVTISLATTFAVAQDQAQDSGVVTFSCLKHKSGSAGEATSEIAELERSSDKIPLPESKETCSSYMARLSTSGITRTIERGRSANFLNSVQIQPASCGLVPRLLPPSQQRRYYQCLFVQIHWNF